MTMTPEQAVYSAAFTQALAVACCLAPNLGVVGGLECIPPNETSINSAKQWAEAPSGRGMTPTRRPVSSASEE